MSETNPFQRLAEQVAFSGLTGDKLREKGFGMRDGKSFVDLRKAIQAGNGRLERELDCIATYLAKVLVRPYSVGERCPCRRALASQDASVTCQCGRKWERSGAYLRYNGRS